MKEIIQLYTDTIKGNFYNSRSLLFLSEGYKAVDEALFYKDVFHLLERLGETFPTIPFSYKTSDTQFLVLTSLYLVLTKFKFLEVTILYRLTFF